MVNYLWLLFVEKVLAGAIAIRELLKNLSISLGYVDKQFGGKSIFGEMKENAEATNEAVETLKRNLLGFDKLNVLGSTNTDGTGTDYSLLTDKIKEYATSLDNVKNKANELATKILEWLGYTYDINGNLEGTGERLKTIFNVVTGIISYIVSSAIISKVIALAKTIKDMGGIGKVLSGVGGKLGIIGAVVAVLVTSFSDLYNSSEDFRKSVKDTFSTLKENLDKIWEFLKFAYEKSKPVLDFIWNIIKEIGGLIVGDILKVITAITEILTGDFVGAWNIIVDAMRDLGDMIARIFGQENWKQMIGDIGAYIEKLFDDIKIIGASVWAGFTSGFKSFINFFAQGINTVIKGLNKINFSLPDWIPGIGGSSFGISIPEIPMLANGGVLDQPTVVMAGEYAGAKQNKEIVTPENLMRDVFIESMLPIAQMIVNGNNDVVSAIGDLANRPVELNGRRVSENIYDDLQNVALRKGKIMFANAR